MVTKGRIEEEKEKVAMFISYYCKHRHGSDHLCDSCAELLRYAESRLEKCRYSDMKPTCRKCVTHCYQKQQREDIRKVMRYCGPRSIWIMPLYSLKHWWRENKK